METLGDKNLPKICQIFYCNICDYTTSKKSSYNDHLLSRKHSKQSVGDIKGDINSAFLLPFNKNQNLVCEICNKQYTSRNGLWKHKKNCISVNNVENEQIKITDDNLILMLINQCKELRDENKELIQIIKNGTHNTNSNNNSHNKTFNLQLFLNETCKDAMNITDFVDSIKLQLSDLEKVGELGYVKGISNIITSNLKALDVTQRPIHCTDKKREVLYIKDKNKWEKENDDKNTIRKAIKSITIKSQRLIPKFREKHPDCNTSESPFSNQYNNIIIESMGDSNYNNKDNEEKIIKNITNSVIIDKELY